LGEFDVFSGVLGSIDSALFMFEQTVRRTALFMQGAPVLLVIITFFHLAVRNFLAPFLGREGASLVALGAVALGIGIFGFRAAGNPALVWAVLAWAANAGGTVIGQIVYSLRR
jgi:hypothetical protein